MVSQVVDPSSTLAMVDPMHPVDAVLGQSDSRHARVRTSVGVPPDTAVGYEL